jgi:hypothetical protein
MARLVDLSSHLFWISPNLLRIITFLIEKIASKINNLDAIYNNDLEITILFVSIV